jgi:hypothetical protein
MLMTPANNHCYLQEFYMITDICRVFKFMFMQVIALNPIASITWIIGLFHFLFNKEGKKFRVFGLVYVIIAGIFMLQQTKYYLLKAYYPILFAGEAVFLSKLLSLKKISWLKPVYVSLVILVV